MLKKTMLIMLSLVTAFALYAGGGQEAAPAAGELGGKIVVYSPNSDGELEGLLYYWADKNGVTVELQSMGTGEVLSKLTAEKNNPQADVQFGGMNLGVWTNNKDLYYAYTAKGDELLPEGYRNKTGYFTNYLLSGSNLLVNTDLEAQLGLNITGYEDLLNPDLKGKIAMGDPTSSSSAFAQLTNMLVVMGDGSYEDHAAWGYVDKLFENLDGKIIGSSSAVYRNTQAGEYVVALTYEDPSVALVTDGATNVRVVYPEEGAVWLPAASAIIEGAPNLDNAKAFLDFLISDEGQRQVAGLTNRPVNINIPNTNPNMTPFSDINLAFDDIQYTADNRSALQQRAREIIQKYTR